MNIEYFDDLILYDYEPTIDSFKEELIWGLQQDPKIISSKFLYDERGSRLFRDITVLDEYYPTRTEMTIMRDHLPEISALIGDKAQVIEFGTGAGLKTKLLLKALKDPSAYVPIDISREQLLDSATELALQFPDLEVWPVCADYTDKFQFPSAEKETYQTVVFFPGSTIGNFTPEEATRFLANVSKLIGPGGALLIGVDLVKDVKILEAAYNDSKGVTAAFNLNLINRINREFQTNLDIHNFEHFSFFNTAASRIEMHLVSLVDQSLELEYTSVKLQKGEHITTEYSYKYSLENFREVAKAGGFTCLRTWTDKENLFSMHYCVVE